MPLLTSSLLLLPGGKAPRWRALSYLMGGASRQSPCIQVLFQVATWHLSLVSDENHKLMFMHSLTNSLSLSLHTSIVKDELYDILDLLQGQSQLPLLALVAMDPGYHSTILVASFEGFEAPIADRVEEEERLLADSSAVVMERGVRLASLLPTERLRREASGPSLDP